MVDAPPKAEVHLVEMERVVPAMADQRKDVAEGQLRAAKLAREAHPVGRTLTAARTEAKGAAARSPAA